MNKKIFSILLLLFTVTMYGIIYMWQRAEDHIEIKHIKQTIVNTELKVNLTVTAYSPQETETDSTPFTTAFQKPVKAGIIAISRDLERVYGWKEGDIIELEGLGLFEVGDRMHRRWMKRVDIFHWFAYDAREFGMVKTKGWKVDA